ncbi:hypothetical protein K445DRAFT_300163 [Daldinia sp. EC12]|nr:hypothetical protein K445DRAFT_300163 [Daldinia sp. EC12]
MPWSISSSNKDQSTAEDISSVGTMSVSDSKSYGSTFSRRHFHRASSSTHYTSPLRSTPPSPALRPTKPGNIDQKDATLFGIEPNHDEENQRFPFHETLGTRTNDTWLHYSSQLETSLFDQNDDLTFPRIQETPISGKASSMRRDINLSIADTPLDYSVGAGTPSSHGSFDSTDKNLNDDDIDLEKGADDALSGWFGISLRRLIRPIRVIYAFEQVKGQCASILRDEGHCLQDDEFEATPKDVYDAGESGRSNCAIKPLADNSNSSPSRGSIPLGGSTSQSGSSPQNSLSVKGKNKKFRIQEGFSCPYRKRNPIRFNIHDHEKCANRSFSSMTELKKHLTSIHFRGNRCARCQEEFLLSRDLMMHYEHCTYPPGSRARIQDLDPEDGFGETVDSQLRSRGMNQKIQNWVQLWEALFPGDTTIPDHEFDPVVEDYEIFDRYELTKWNLSQRLEALMSSPTPNKENLPQMIMDLFQENMEMLLPKPKAFRQRRQISLDTPFELGCPGSMISTPRCFLPDGVMDEAQGEQRHVYNFQNVDFSSGSLSTQPMDHVFDCVLNRGIEPQSTHSNDFDPLQMNNNNLTGSYDGATWPHQDQISNRNPSTLMDAVALSGDTYQPNLPDGFDVVTWVVDGGGQFFIGDSSDSYMGLDSS